MPIVWDEGDTIFRAERVAYLFERAGEPDVSERWESVRSGASWPFTTILEGHPPLAAMLVALGEWAAPQWLDPLTRERFGPIALFALAIGAMFYRLVRDYQLWVVGAMAVGALLTMPRLFAHAHYATLDGPLTASWILAWATFGPACRNPRWILGFGLALGLTFSAKFTGWLAPLAFLAWTITYRDRRAAVVLATGVALAMLVFVGFNPPLWSHPYQGLCLFFDLNLHRDARPELNISTQFFGRMYNLDHPLPWYNTLVWTLITISPMPLVLGIAGIVSSLKNWSTDRFAVLVFCNWATLILVRAWPGTPPHDGERLILPSFAFFAMLVGIGVGRGLYRRSLLERDKIVAQGWAKVAMTIALTAATVDSLGYYPLNLSYYNRLIGGIRGATWLGMEPTYYWDALDRPALAWLDEHTGSDQKIYFASAPWRNLRLLHRWGQLARLPHEPGTFRWYVLQRRPSAWQPADRWLIEHATPAYQTILSGVPLLDVYDYGDYLKAEQALKAPD